jgi:hypothetical protein
MQEGTIKVNIEPTWAEFKVCPVMSTKEEVLCKRERCAWWTESTDYKLGRSVLKDCALPLVARFLADMD